MAPALRAARPADRTALIALLDRTFAHRPFPESFGIRFPHLFTDSAIGQHRLATSGKTIVACVGAYQFDASFHGQPLRIAGIGQVATDRQVQGQGLMTQLLAEALASATEVDLWWLYGDRRRYGRCGFAPGGSCVIGTTWDRYCTDVPRQGPPIRSLDPATDDDHIDRALARQPFHLRLEPAARQRLLDGCQARGWTDGEATILLDREARCVWAVTGEPARIARLIAHQVDQHRTTTPQHTHVRLEADPTDALALQLVRQLAGELSTRPTASLRIGRLAPLLRAWGTVHPPPPGARLRSLVLDGGAAGRLRIAAVTDRWECTTTQDPPDLHLEDAALAECIVGTVPLAAWELPAESVLHALLPIPVMIPGVYAL